MIMRLLNTLGLIFLGIAVGYAIQRRYVRGRGHDLSRIQRRLQKFALLGLNPIIFVGAVWLVPLEETALVAMPFVALFALFLGGALAWILARSLGLSRPSTGAHIAAGWFTNIGSIGALVVFVLLGEEAFALVPIYKLLEELSYYTLGFPLLRSFSEAAGPDDATGPLRRVIRDPFVLVATGSILAGLALNALDFERPQFWGPLNGALVPLSSFILLTTIGMTMSVTSVRRNFVASLGIVAIKHVVVPAATTALAALIGFGATQDGIPLRVVLILSCMPAGFISIVATSLYKLDVDLANSNWLLSNLSLLVVIPLVMLLLPAL